MRLSLGDDALNLFQDMLPLFLVVTVVQCVVEFKERRWWNTDLLLCLGRESRVIGPGTEAATRTLLSQFGGVLSWSKLATDILWAISVAVVAIVSLALLIGSVVLRIVVRSRGETAESGLTLLLRRSLLVVGGILVELALLCLMAEGVVLLLLWGRVLLHSWLSITAVLGVALVHLSWFIWHCRRQSILHLLVLY